jgi:hypothetical protein
MLGVGDPLGLGRSEDRAHYDAMCALSHSLVGCAPRLTQFRAGLPAWESGKALRILASCKETIAGGPPAKIYDVSPEV